MDPNAKRETHPAYALIGISRWTRGGATEKSGAYRLFGSSVNNYSGISLEISRAEVVHDLGSDHYSEQECLIEVEMSEAQFASLITTMNSGPGVPCTLRYIDKKKVEDLPNKPMETEKIRRTFEKKMERWETQFKEMADEIKGLLAKKSLLAADKKRITDLTVTISMEMKNNITFLMDQFNASADDVVAQAKAEIEGFVNAVVRKTGLEQIKQHGVGLLEYKEEPKP